MMKMKFLTSTFLLLAIASGAAAQGQWAFEICSGSAYSFSTSVKIEQPGEEDLKFTADYATKPFKGSPYYAWRISKWKEKGAWELEFIHHKLYVENPPVHVRHFEITHGYNMLVANRAWEKEVILRVGAGIVITHPETEVRGVYAAPGYNLTGPVTQVGVGKRFYPTKPFFISLEGKLTLARSRIPVHNGNADVPNVAVHVLLGLGFVQD